MQPNEELINIIYETAIANTEINFDTVITSFLWEKLFIISPFSIPSQLFKTYEIVPQNINTNIEIFDGIALLVFVYNNYVVGFVDYPYRKGNFINRIIPNESHYKAFYRHSTLFTTEIKSNNIYFRHIKIS